MRRKLRIRRPKPPQFDALGFTLKLLNTAPEAPYDKELIDELKRLVNLWLASGPNTAKMTRDLPSKIECVLQPTATGRVLAIPFTAGGTRRKPKPAEVALKIFLQFILSEDCVGPGGWARLGGPCACGCGQYFLKKSTHKKTFCFGHGSRYYAREGMKAKQALKRAPRVRKVNRAIAAYIERRRRGDWKIFVSSESGVPINTLERWIQKGFVAAPKTKGR
jgi:hypothetical protein